MKKLIALFLILTQAANAGLPPTTTKSQPDASPVTTFQTLYPDSTVYHSGVVSTITRNARPTKNYIQFADFENNATTGWSLGTVGALTNNLPTGTPTFGSGASGNLSIATSSSSPLGGTYSLTYVSSAATTQGDMLASSAYSIDSEDQAKILGVKFSYLAGANANWSGTSSNSYAWAAWDVTNSVWMSSVGNFCTVQSTGVGVCTGTFQTGSSTASIRFVLYNANATSGASTLKLDNFFTGPQISPLAPAMSDPVAYTPTITSFGSPTNVAFYYWRNGKNLILQGSFTAGTTTAAIGSVSIPSGLAIDTTVLSITGNTTSSEGSQVGVYSGQGAGGQGSAVTAPGTSTSLIYFGEGWETVSATKGLIPQNANHFCNTGSVLSFNASVPIVGWSSNSVASSDTDTRVVAAQIGLTAAVTPSANAVIKYDTPLSDTNSAYSASTGLYTVPVSGKYRVSISAVSTGGSTTPYLVKNGTGVSYITASVSGSEAGGSISVPCSSGDTLAVYTDSSHTFPGVSGGIYQNFLSIERLSGPAVITATETVAASYYASASFNSATTQSANFDTKLYDTHNAVSASAAGTGAWKFTAPVSGMYRVSANLSGGPVGAVAGLLFIYKNGSSDTPIGSSPNIGTSSLPGSGTIQLNAGDFIDIRASNSQTYGGGAKGTTNESIVSIERLK